MAGLISACASSPELTLDQKEAIADSYSLPHEPGDDQAYIYVLRTTILAGATRFKIYLDGKKEDGKYIGYTRQNQFLAFPVSVGEHDINSKAENWASVHVDAKNGESIFLQQSPSFGVLFARNAISRIDEVEGRYLMSESGLSEGTYTQKE